MCARTPFFAFVCVLLFSLANAAHAAGTYAEDFSDGLAQGWTASGSQFTVLNGYYKNDSDPISAISVYGGDTWAADYTYRARLYSDYTASGNVVGAIYNYQDDSNYYEVWFNTLDTVKLNKVVGGVRTTIETSTAVINPDTYFNVEIIRNGTLTTVKVNNVTVFSGVNQTEFGAGKIGVFTIWNIGRFDDVQVDPHSDDYAEDFNDGLAQNWSTVGSTYTVTGGYYTNDDYMQHKALSVYDGNTWTSNYTYNVRLYADFPASGNAVAAIFNYQNADNFYEARFSVTNQSVQLNKMVGGTLTTVAQTAGSGIVADQFFNVQIIRSGDDTTVKVNGVTKLANVAMTGFGAGKIGVRAEFNRGQFDDVSLLATGGVDQSGPRYPRIGTVRIGGPHNYDNVAVQAEIGRAHVAILNYWKGWDNGKAMTMNQAVQGIKTQAVDQEFPTKVFLYINNGEFNDTPGQNDTSTPELTNKLNAEGWWLLAGGQRVVSPYKATFDLVNTTTYVDEDANGMDWAQWYATWVKDNYYTPNPNIDGFFTDNVYWYPLKDGDWNVDGTTDDNANNTVRGWFRTAFREHFDTLNTLMPGKQQIANFGAWADPGAIIAPQFTGMVDGGTLENAITLGNSYESQTAGWAGMMTRYRKLMADADGEKLVLLMQEGSATDYKVMRYGLGSTLLDDGYFAFTSGTNYNNTLWFDEYGFDVGYPTTPPPTAAWNSGVYRRDFQNGIVLVNPKGNGVRTVTVGPGFRRFSGTQDATTNSGAVATNVTLQERDAILLSRD